MAGTHTTISKTLLQALIDNAPDGRHTDALNLGWPGHTETLDRIRVNPTAVRQAPADLLIAALGTASADRQLIVAAAEHDPRKTVRAAARQAAHAARITLGDDPATAAERAKILDDAHSAHSAAAELRRKKLPVDADTADRLYALAQAEFARTQLTGELSRGGNITPDGAQRIIVNDSNMALTLLRNGDATIADVIAAGRPVTHAMLDRITERSDIDDTELAEQITLGAPHLQRGSRYTIVPARWERLTLDADTRATLLRSLPGAALLGAAHRTPSLFDNLDDLAGELIVDEYRSADTPQRANMIQLTSALEAPHPESLIQLGAALLASEPQITAEIFAGTADGVWATILARTLWSRNLDATTMQAVISLLGDGMTAPDALDVAARLAN